MGDMSKWKLVIVVILAILFVLSIKACQSNNIDTEDKVSQEVINEIDDSSEDITVEEEQSESEDFDLEEIAMKNTTKVDGGDIDRTAEERAIQQYGTEAINQAKETAKKAVELWIYENSDEAQWKNIATDEFYEKKVKNLGLYEIGNMSTVTRTITKLEPAISESEETNHLNIGFNTEMDILSNNQVVNHQNLLYDVDMVNVGGKWIVNNIVVYTNHLGNS